MYNIHTCLLYDGKKKKNDCKNFVKVNIVIALKSLFFPLFVPQKLREIKNAKYIHLLFFFYKNFVKANKVYFPPFCIAKITWNQKCNERSHSLFFLQNFESSVSFCFCHQSSASFFYSAKLSWNQKTHLIFSEK